MEGICSSSSNIYKSPSSSNCTVPFDWNTNNDNMSVGRNTANTIPLFYVASDHAVSVTTTEAGTLEVLLSSQSPESITSLTISGPLNAKDLVYLKSLFSGDWFKENENYRVCNLQSLDLLNARFVKSNYQFTEMEYGTYGLNIASDSCFSDIDRIADDGVRYSTCNYLAQNKSLKTLILPSNIRYIGNFHYGTNLENIVLPESLEEIASWTFRGCGIKSIFIPRNVKKIGLGIFESCNNLESIDVDPQNSMFNGWLNYYGSNSIIGYDYKLYAGCKNTDLSVGYYEKIGYGAFYECEGLMEIEIPSFVKTIDGVAFFGCKNLKKLKLNEGLKSINLQAFYGCESLTEVTFPNSLDSLGCMAFCQCNIKDVKLHKNLKWYGRALKSTLRKEMPVGNKSGFYNHDINYYEYVSPFYMDPIEKISIDKENPYFQSFDDACVVETATQSLIDGFGNFTIPDCVKRLADRALDNYSSTEIVIPEQVESIVCDNFQNGIKKMTILPETPPVIEKREYYKKINYEYIDYCKADVYVHAWSLAKYKANPIWSKSNIYPIENMYYLVDGIVYDNLKNKDYESISYTRTFNNTAWQSFYIPFSLNYDDWKDDFEVAYINGVRQLDKDDNGTIDETIMDVIKIKSGSTTPNMPYLIKAKTTGEKTFYVSDATLYPAEENSIDCSTTIAKYTFTGTYNSIPSATMIANNYYGMGGGELVQSDGSNDLKPYRWYMKVESRNPSYNVSNAAKTITINVIDEEGETTTGIRQLQMTNDELPVYDLNGRKINENNLKPGIYVKNGKKFVVK